GAVRARLHADEAAQLAVDDRRRGARRAAARDRLGRLERHARARSLGAVRDHVLLADAARARDLVHVSRGLRTRRHPRAAGGGSGRPQHRVPDAELLCRARAGEPAAVAHRDGGPAVLRQRRAARPRRRRDGLPLRPASLAGPRPPAVLSLARVPAGALGADAGEPGLIPIAGTRAADPGHAPTSGAAADMSAPALAVE